MALIADSGALYALVDADDEHHEAVREVVESEVGPIIVPTAILAEVDYLLLTHLGVDHELAFLEDLGSGAYSLEPLTPPDLIRARELIAQYRELRIGLADAAVAATAERLGIFRILTTDLRHFRAIHPRKGKHYVLLPADAE
jgi:predicted nucleic acid-binding protein